MANLLWNVRNVALLLTAIGRMLVENPASLINNAQEKLRQKGYLPSSLIRTVKGATSSSITLLLREGEPSEALRRFEQLHPLRRILFRAQKRKICDQLALLNAPVANSRHKKNNERLVSGPCGPIKTLYFVNNSVPFTQSGYTLRTHKLLQALHARGIKIAAMTRLGYPIVIGGWPKQFRDVIGGIEYLRLIPWIYPKSEGKRIEKAIRSLVQESRRRGIQILHTTTDFKNGLVVSEAARRLGVPWVYEVRGQLESTWLSNFPLELQNHYINSEHYVKTSKKEVEVMKSANAVIVLSEVSRNDLVERGVKQSKIFVVPNAVDPTEIVTDFSKTQLRSELMLNVAPGDIVFGTVSSVVDYEGLDSAVLSLHYLPANFKLLVVGDGSSKPSLEQLVVTEGLEKRVIFVGRQPYSDVWKWYGALDVFVVPRRDTRVCRVVTPIKTITAQAMGIPVVASNLPALREIAKGALFVPPENPQQLAGGILSAIDGRNWESTNDSFIAAHTWESNATIVEQSYWYALNQFRH